MSDIKPIKTRDDYEEALTLLGGLIDQNPVADSSEDAKLQILVALIEDYENSTLPDYQVDPIEAIKLRIEQLGLKEVDLVPYLGSRSRVSEILSGKRKLTVEMIQNLEEGLGIPASILVGSSRGSRKNNRWAPRTLALMARRGYFGDDNREMDPKKIIELGLLRNLFTTKPLASAVLLRQSNYRDISKVDSYLLEAWTNKVLKTALESAADHQISAYGKNKITKEGLANLFKLSSLPTGVIEVISSLERYGIVVVVEPGLPNTRLDGATLFSRDYPVIGITLRYDRLDSFWFTLAHELSHVYLHRESDFSSFYDQLFEPTAELIDVEEEADSLAGELLIPSAIWKLSPLRYASTPTLVRAFAKKIGVHESIVAGRIRHDSKDWSVHSDLVTEQPVRDIFKDKLW